METLSLSSRIGFQAVLSPDVNTQTILHVYKVCFVGLSVMSFFRAHIMQWLLCQTDEINTTPSPSYIYGSTGEF